MAELHTRRRQTIEENLTQNETFLNSLPQLAQAPQVTFDLNVDGLRQFLNEMSNTVNQHSKFLKSLFKELNIKVPNGDIFQILQSLSSSIPRDFGGSLSNLNNWQDGLASTSSGLQGISLQLSNLINFKQEITTKFNNLQEKLETKASHEEVETVLRKTKVLLDEKVSKDEMKARLQDIEKIIKVTEDKLSLRINELEKKFQELEINTLWKLKDCEELLKVRVNEKFVWDAINSVEGKIKREIFNESQGRLEKLEAELRNIGKEMGRMLEDEARKDKEIKAKIHEINEQFTLKAGKIEHNQLAQLMKNLASELDALKAKQTNEYDEKLKNIEKDIERLMNSQNNSIIEALSERVKKLEESLIELLNRPPVQPQIVSVEKFERSRNPSIDRDLLSQLVADIEALKILINTKADKDIIQELQSMQKQHPVIVSQPSGDVNELWKFREKAMQNFKDINDRFEKIIKKLELKGIKKQILTKADDEATKRSLRILEEAVERHEQAFVGIQRQLEALQKALAKLFSMFNEFSVQSGSALISRKTFAPLTCLSCGRGDTQYLPPLPQVQGADGRMYQADTQILKNATLSASMTDLPKLDPDSLYQETSSPIPSGAQGMTQTIPLKGSMRSTLSVVIGKDQKVAFRSEKSRNRPQSARIIN
mmetsp:Transcript_10715/g.10745  ORF Transcript_10715/g.10745 Transcript_10715/m.10745 type:complete len:653 (-) Transcript_10715:6-1964(-)